MSGVSLFLGSAPAPPPSSASDLGSFIIFGLGGTQIPAPASSPTTTAAALIVVDNQTLIPGAPAVTVSGTPVSLASIPTAIVIGTETIPIGRASTPSTTVAPGPIVIGYQILTSGGPAVITLSGGQTISFTNSSTAPVVGTQAILPGAPGVTISGIENSLAPSGTAAVIDGETVRSVVPSGTSTVSGFSPAVYTGVASRSLSITIDCQRVIAIF